MEFKLNVIVFAMCLSPCAVKYMTKCSRIAWILTLYRRSADRFI